MRVESKDLGGFSAYAYGTAAWLGLQSVVLLLLPKLVFSLLSKDESHHTSDLELYFARSTSFALATLALVVLFFTGTIPLPTTSEQSVALENTEPKAPYAVPIVYVTAFYHISCAVYCYVRWTYTDQSGFLLGFIASGGLAALGGWSAMFGGTTRVSARTGQDKRTSGFLFPNSSAYDKKEDRKAR